MFCFLNSWIHQNVCFNCCSLLPPTDYFHQKVPPCGWFSGVWAYGLHSSAFLQFVNHWPNNLPFFMNVSRMQSYTPSVSHMAAIHLSLGSQLCKKEYSGGCWMTSIMKSLRERKPAKHFLGGYSAMQLLLGMYLFENCQWSAPLANPCNADH